MARHNELGKTGEQLAVEHLIKQGYTIREINWKSGRLELDIVAQMGITLVVVEVKTRHNEIYGHPVDAVTEKKIRHIVNAAEAYLRMFDLPFEVRFDIISIVLSDGQCQIEHIEDAFYAPLN